MYKKSRSGKCHEFVTSARIRDEFTNSWRDHEFVTCHVFVARNPGEPHEGCSAQSGPAYLNLIFNSRVGQRLRLHKYEDNSRLQLYK